MAKPTPPPPLPHQITLSMSQANGQLIRLAKRWTQSHTYRYERFATSAPHFHNCSYAIKTRYLCWAQELGDWITQMTQLRDNLDSILLELEELDIPIPATQSED